MKEIIKLAIEGGYSAPAVESTIKFWEEDKNNPEEAESYAYWVVMQSVLNPKFWECLGKSLGWEKWTCHSCGEKYLGDKLCPKCKFGKATRKDWTHHWHRFIDHLASEKDPELFFKELLDNK